MVVKAMIDPRMVLLLNEVKNTSTFDEFPYDKITKEYFIDDPLPTTDVEKGPCQFGLLKDYKPKYMLAAGSILKAKMITNCIHYPPMSVMDWHTNSDLEGTRHYYTYTEGEAIFKYVDENGDVVLDYDDVGWTHRVFKIRKDKPLWHSVWAGSDRYSFGFMTDD